jgi:anti-sigma factor RsiW
MQILWKRLIKGGETCTRCEDTGRELEAAVAKLAAALRPLEIEPVLEMQEIDEAEFKANTSESNRVWIAGKSIEEWLGADVGMSRCCSVCGDSNCRTLEVGGHTYETIPEEQFIKAGLMAASQMIVSASSSNR